MTTKKVSTKKINTYATRNYNLITHMLLTKYSEDYEIMQNYAIKGLNDKSINILEKRIAEIMCELDISLISSMIHPPKTSENHNKYLSKHGHISHEYFTLELQFCGGVFYIRHASIERMKNSSTSSKEILFMHCILSLHKYKTFSISSKHNNLMDYKYTLCQLINDIKENGIKNAYLSDIDVLIEELEYELRNFTGASNKSMRKTILNAMSGGNYIKRKKVNNEYTPYRNDAYNIIRAKIGEITKSKRVDNVYPVDVIFIKNGFENIINTIIEDINKLPIDEQIIEFYKYFMNMEDYDNGIRLPFLGISLKQQIACAGKGKSAVGKLGNLTEYEKNLSTAEALKLIYEKRLMMANLNISGISYKIYGKMDEFENTICTIDKLSAAKLVTYMLSYKATYDEIVEYIETVIATCAGVGQNPPYSKIIMSEHGLYEKVKCVNYEKNYRLKISKSAKIEIVDKNSSNVIDIIFSIDIIDQFTGKIIQSPAKLEIRTNNSGSKQSTVELKYI